MFNIFKHRATEKALDARIANVELQISAEKVKARAALYDAHVALADCQRKAAHAPREFARSFRAEIACRRAIIARLESLV